VDDTEWDHAQRALADRPGTFRDELADFYRRIGFGDLEETVKIGRPTRRRRDKEANAL